MVYPGVLIGLFLFSLISSGVSAEEVDQNTLAKIIQFINTNYQPPGQTDSGDGVQYAVAINVPKEKCGPGFSEGGFLSVDSAKTVKEALENHNLYQGTQLVAATPKGEKTTAVHSERALLMCEASSDAVTPVQNLLNKDQNGCVVFYTYNSPCLDFCLNQAKDDNEQNRENKQNERNQKKNIESTAAPAVKKCILKSLSVLTNHVGPKAFVFSRVYRKDENKPTLKAALKVVAEQVPLYKCDAGSCVKCLSDGEIISQCLS
ncbi:uncharacterized protein LOC122133180 [Clupea harengus]|uniref:Uncharacterized protein LOC122133180 n=1 Tax=Clupea harengus TaxID=7950 RepID=A0A8M1KQ19_CLUHA|nr:uncharacterized protein LOC122133180 [Clupea harengus]